MSDQVAVRTLLAEGYCTPSCLLAAEEGGACHCRCLGRFHGALEGAAVDAPPDDAPRSMPLIAAEGFTCDLCQKKIAKTATHAWLRDLGMVIHLRCIPLDRSTISMHTTFYPDCPDTWHDMWDHDVSTGTRAGIRAALRMESA